LLGSLENWQSMSKRLAQSYKVCSLDLRNHGRSPHSDSMNYPAMARDVARFIADHKLAPASILGHSMGGKVAMQLVADCSEELETLMVVDIAPKAYPPAHAAMLRAMREIDLAVCKSFGEVAAALSGAIPDPSVRQFIVKSLTRDSGGVLHWRLGLDEIIQNYPALTQAIVVENSFPKPACFIRAGRSDFVLDDDLPLIRQSFPRAEFRTIADAGHWVHVDCADEFHSAVADFLSRTVG
jgi:pimeloyl-ACP methyl ester carboxylesterase